jgi:hypothetical protein
MAIVANGAEVASLLLPEVENHIGSANMHTPAKSNLILTDFSSFERLAELERGVSHAGLYQAIGQTLISAIRTNQAIIGLASGLISVADHAYAIRALDVVSFIGQLLSGLPVSDELQSIGHYYEALSLNRSGCGDTVRAGSLLERVADEASLQFRARAMVAFGTNSLMVSNPKSAMFFYQEAMRITERESSFDPVSLYFASQMTTVVKAFEGDHRGALRDLEKMLPLVRFASSSQPYAYYDYLNSLAVELCEVGRLEEAENVSRIVLASPYSGAYPEWRDTRDEIQLKGRRASRSTVAFSQTIYEADNPSRTARVRADTDSAVTKAASPNENLVRLPVPERAESFRQSTATSELARVLSIQDWIKSMPKQSTSDPRQKTISKAAIARQKQARLRELRNLETRELLFGLMDAVGDESISDDQIIRALIVLEGLEPDSDQSA